MKACTHQPGCPEHQSTSCSLRTGRNSWLCVVFCYHSFGQRLPNLLNALDDEPFSSAMAQYSEWIAGTGQKGAHGARSCPQPSKFCLQHFPTEACRPHIHIFYSLVAATAEPEELGSTMYLRLRRHQWQSDSPWRLKAKAWPVAGYPLEAGGAGSPSSCSMLAILRNQASHHSDAPAGSAAAGWADEFLGNCSLLDAGRCSLRCHCIPKPGDFSAGFPCVQLGLPQVSSCHCPELHREPGL